MDLFKFINLNNLNNLNNLDFIAKGGPVMFILLGFSIFAFAIIFIKLVQFFSVALTSNKNIDIKDLAKKLNLSVSSVSRALNGHANISTKTTNLSYFNKLTICNQ